MLISDSNAGYTMFRGSEGYWLPTPFASFPFTSPPVRHHVPTRFNWTLPTMFGYKSVHRIHLAQDMISGAMFFEKDNEAFRS